MLAERWAGLPTTISVLVAEPRLIRSLATGGQSYQRGHARGNRGNGVGSPEGRGRSCVGGAIALPRNQHADQEQIENIGADAGREGRRVVAEMIVKQAG